MACVVGIRLTAAIVAAVVFFTPPLAAAQATSCSMFVVAHEDDDLLFQSPALLRTIASHRCERTVYVTAGDAGLGSQYWAARERGEQAAYALMAHVASDWTASTIDVQGHPILLDTLIGRPDVSLVFMRLPDGSPDGTGTARYGNQSLEKLWNGGISHIDAVDGSTSYGSDGLIRTLTSLMTSLHPSQIAVQDYLAPYGGGDHSDHVAVARFAELAHLGDAAPHDFTGYQDYGTSARSPNVLGSQLDAKRSAFYAYGSFDSHTCAGDASCAATSYASWLQRQYVVGSEPVGVVANAGYTDIAGAGAMETLDGSLSSAAGNAALHYAWMQTSGPGVALSGSDTAFPSFVVPPGPAALRFSLTVSTASATSAPDVVTILVPGGPNPAPVASAGPARSVPSGASVTLDGSKSSDPYAQPLTYAWTQIAGPLVDLSSASSANPVFAAPPGPATLTFSLTVSNDVATSLASTVTVTVAAADPAERNVARIATADASSQATADGQVAASAIDGVIGGYPIQPAAEWATLGEGVGASLRLAWPTSMELDHVVLYDRPDHDDQITSGTLSFSDGSSVAFGALPDDAATGRLVTFSPRVTTRLVMTVTGVSPTTVNAGLAELQAWGAEPEAPSITSAAATAFTVGAAGSFTVESSGYPAPALTESGALPDGLGFADRGDRTAIVSGTPTAAGVTTVDLVATNAAGAARQRFTITVLAAEATPEPIRTPELTTAASDSPVVDRAPAIATRRIDIITGRRSRHVIAVDASPRATVWLSGRLGTGIRATVNADGDVVVTSSRSVRAPARYRLVVHAANRAGAVRRVVSVRVRRRRASASSSWPAGPSP